MSAVQAVQKKLPPSLPRPRLMSAVQAVQKFAPTHRLPTCVMSAVQAVQKLSMRSGSPCRAMSAVQAVQKSDMMHLPGVRMMSAVQAVQKVQAAITVNLLLLTKKLKLGSLKKHSIFIHPKVVQNFYRLLVCQTAVQVDKIEIYPFKDYLLKKCQSIFFHRA